MNASLSLSILLGVLQTLGIILLWILLILAVVILLILFVPVKYQAEGALEDPEPHDAFDDTTLESLKANAHGAFSFRWLLGAVRGGIGWPGEPVFTVHILAWEINVNEMLEKQKAKRAEKEAEEKRLEREKRRKAGLPEEENAGRKDLKEERKEKLRKVRERLPEYRKFWNRKSTRRALQAVWEDGGGAVLRILPGEWSLTGTVGLGDPKLAGDLMAVEGFLVPLTGEHVRVLPEYQKIQMDLQGYARGRIRIAVLVAAALKLLFNKDVKKAARFVREQKAYLES